MAERLTITRLIDLIVKTGKIDVKGFEKEYEKAVSQAVAKLPAAEAAIGVNIKPKRGFNPQKIQEQFAKALNVASEKGLEGTKAFQQLEKVITHYQDTLTKLAAVSAGAEFKFSKKFLAEVAAVKAGSKDLNSLDPNKLSKYQAYLTGLQKIIAQIEQANLRVSTSITAKDFTQAKAEVKAADKAAKAANLEYSRASAAAAKIDQTKHKGDFAAAKQRLDEAELARIAARERQDTARASLETMEVSKQLIGAHISDFIQTSAQNVKKSLDDVNKLVAGQTPAAQEKRNKQEQRDAQQVSNETLRTRRVAAKNQEKLEQPEKLRQQLETLVAGRTPEQIAALPGHERGLITKAINRYQSAIDAVEGKTRSLLDANYQELMRFADSIKEHRKPLNRRDTQQQAQLDRLETLGRARSLTDALAPAATNRKDLRQEFSTWDRQKLEELKVLVSQERRILDEMVKQGHTDEERLKRLGELKRRIAEAEKKLNNKEAEVSRRDKAAFIHGQAAYKAAGGDPNRIPAEARRDARDYISQRINMDQAKLDSQILKLGPNAAEVKKASQELEHLREVQHRLNDEVKRSHPLWHQAGLLLAQFLRYAIGYGALYKLIQGLQDLGRATINLQDDLKSIQAITGSTAEEMLGMKAVIEEVATTSAFRIDDIASAVRTVVQAGIDLKEVPKAVKAVSDLATASGTSLQVAADIITTAQAVWDDVSPEEIANKVTQAANVSKLAVEDLQSIFNYGASFAENANISLDQFLAQTAALKNAGRRPSTIGTGLSQLYKELFAPDDKFSKFLSDQYATVGERLSTRQARNRFASFTETEDPMQAALQELIRINANSAEATGKLQRSLDQRSYRALSPLLANPNVTAEVTSRMAAAPTAAEAAAVAMDSLKKSASNLRDQIEVLADKLFDPMLEPITEVVNKLTEFSEALAHMVDRAKENTESTGLFGLGAGVATGAVAGYKAAPRGLLKPVGAIAGGLLGGSGFLADRAQAAAGAPDWLRTVGDIVFDVALFKLISRAFRAKVAAGAAAEAAPLAARALAFGKSVLSLVTGFLGKTFAALGGAALTARLAPLVAMAAGIPGVIIAAISTVLAAAAAAVVYKLANSKGEPKVPDLGTGYTARDSSQLATQEAERAAKSNQISTKYAQSFPDQPAPDESLEGKVRQQRQNIGRFLSNLRQGFGIAADQEVDTDSAISRTKALADFRGSAEARQTLLKKLQQDLGGEGALNEEAIKEAQNTASALVSGITALADSLAKDYVELLRKEGKGQLNKEEKKELGLFRRLSDGGKTFFANLIDTGQFGTQRSTEDTLAAVENLAKTGRQFGLKTPERETDRALDTVLHQVAVTANARGTPEAEYEQNQLKIRLRNELQTRPPQFAESVAASFGRLLNSKDEHIRETAASVFDLVLTGLREGLEKNKRDLEGVGKEAGELRTTEKPVTLENSRGETTTLPGTKAKDLLVKAAPTAVGNLDRAITAVDQMLAEKNLAAKSKRYAQFTETLAPLVTVGEDNQRQTNLANFLNLIGKAEGADYNTIVGGGKIAPATFSDTSKHPGIVGYIGPDGKPSTAAGKYQITKQTFDDVSKQIGVTDFSPVSQDKIATFLLFRAKALQDIYEGRFEAAMEKLGGVWASLPSSKYNQPKKPWDWVRKEIDKFPASLTETVNTGALTVDPKGRFGIGEDLRKQSNAEAKANEPKDTERLQKELDRATADVERLTSEIARLNSARSVTGVSDAVNQQIDTQLVQARKELGEALRVQEESRIKLVEPTNREAEKDEQDAQGYIEDRRQIAQASADRLTTAGTVDLQGYTSRLEKITANRDFYLSRGVTEEQLQSTQGLPQSRALAVEREQLQQRLLSALRDELEAKVKEGEAALRTEGLSRQEIDARTSLLDQTRTALKNTKDAFTASRERSKQFYQRDLELNKQTLDTRYQLLAEQRDALASAGRLSEFAGDMENVEKALLDANLKLLQKRAEKGDIPPELIPVEQAKQQTQFDEREFQARMRDQDSRFRLIESGATSFSPDQQFSQAYRIATGSSSSLSEQRLYASNLLNGINEQRLRKEDEIAIQSAIANDPKKSVIERGAARERIAGLNTALQDLAKRAGEAAAEVTNLSPTLGGEFSQISSASISAKLADLPQSLKNFNSNFESRIVDAIDSFAGAVSDAVLEFVGLKDSIDELRDEMRAVGDAQLALSDVQSRSLDTAREIEDIRRSESDPARQEYLIKRALEAQKQAEQVAQNEVNAAQDAYDQAEFDNSFAGKFTEISRQMLSGVIEDLVKGTLLQGFSDLFGFGGKKGDTQFNPLWVKLADSPLGYATGGGAGASGGSGSSGGLFGMFDGLGSSISGLFGGSSGGGTGAGAYGTVSSGTFSKLGETAAGGSSWFSGIGDWFSGAGSWFSEAGSGIMDIFSSLGSLFAFKDGGAVDDAIVGRTKPRIQGLVKGPGTTTSDSVDAKLSRDEYVLNAKTTAWIGKDQLDAWNFGNKNPMKFATGGIVGPLQRSVRDAKAQDMAAAVVSHKPEPVTIRPILVDDHRRVEDFFNTPSGERAMVAFVRKNSLSLRQALQS